ncbi:MAG: hypothetical protein U1E29_12985, partial [Coriobacteriia bacterium]|nr:hypothetical protein [Coriobacteriia bacterium]
MGAQGESGAPSRIPHEPPVPHAPVPQSIALGWHAVWQALWHAVWQAAVPHAVPLAPQAGFAE